MKKFLLVIAIISVLFTVVSCDTVITFAKLENRVRLSDFTKVYEVFAEEGKNAVFYTKKQITDVSVNIMNYDESSDTYTIKETIFTLDILNQNEALDITLDLENEIPHVMIGYTLKNGDRCEQYLYLQARTGRVYLLERE